MSLTNQFNDFDSKNPHVWQMFEKFALDVINRGYRRWSADAVMHQVRWNAAMRSTGERYKISNNYVAFYARKFLDHYPQHEGFFTLRPQKSA